MDGDGDEDIVSAAYEDDTVSWHENDGPESWTEHIITTTANRAYSAVALDVDGDGSVDVFSADYLGNTVALYLSDASQSFATQIITTTALNALSVSATDVDGDDDVDVVSASEEAISWYCLLYTSPSPRDKRQSRMPSSA